VPKFRYRALDASGHMIVGTIEAASNAAVLPALEKISVLPIEISDMREPRKSWRQMFAREPTREEITTLTEDLSTLVGGGVTLDRALLILSETGARAPIGALMLELHRKIAAGQSMAEAVSAYPAIFPKTYVKMVEVAEVAGTLDETLKMIAHERSRTEHLRRRITSALTYPSFLALAATGVLVFVLMYIIPEFDRALSGFQTKMSGSTALVFSLSRGLRENASTAGMIAVGILAVGFLAFRSRGLRSALMRGIGRVPGIRGIVRTEQTVSFCATLGTLSRSGVDITSSLRLIRDLMRDNRSAAKIERLVASVRQGQRLSEALLDVDLLPTYAVHMLRVGEESGEIDSIAVRIASFYEGKLDRSLTRLTSVLGPAIMILVSMLIAWLIISVITALLSMNDLLT
jgi:general secretion pathway protein F